MNHTTKIIFAALLTLTIFSCQKSETNDLQDAQLCLNTAAAADAQNCVSKIASNTSENAYKLRCSAVFISKGFGSPTSFISAMDQIKNGGNAAGCSGSACSGTLAAMGTLNFGSDTAAANSAFSECSNSGVGIYAQISSVFKLGTLFSVLLPPATPGTSLTPAQLESVIASVSDADVGNVIISTYGTSCADTTNAADSTKQYCSELAAAIAAGSSPAVIGAFFKNKLDTP